MMLRKRELTEFCARKSLSSARKLGEFTLARRQAEMNSLVSFAPHRRRSSSTKSLPPQKIVHPIPIPSLSRGALFLGACAMTTKFLDNKNRTFKILLPWRFPRKTAFWTNFLSAPKPPPPPLNKQKNYFYCRLAVSEFWLASTLKTNEQTEGKRNLSKSALDKSWGLPGLLLCLRASEATTTELASTEGA